MFIKTALVTCFVWIAGFGIQQNNSISKKEIKKDANEVASGAKHAWQDAKKGGRAVGHKTKRIVKAIEQDTKKTLKDVKREVKK